METQAKGSGDAPTCASATVSTETPAATAFLMSSDIFSLAAAGAGACVCAIGSRLSRSGAF